MRIAALLVVLALTGCGKAPPVPTKAEFTRLSAAPAENGKRLVAVLGCAGCHGETLTGNDWSSSGYVAMFSANLTRSAPLYDDAQLRSVITSGQKPDGTPLWEMPSHLFTQLAPADMAAIIAYLRTLPPEGDRLQPPQFGEAALQDAASGTWRSSARLVREQGGAWPPDAGADHALGRYVVRATCAQCHGMNLRGGGVQPGSAARADLRVAARYDAASFDRLLTTGIAADGRDLGLMSAVSRTRYSRLTAEERAAVHAYLAALGSPAG